jgi:3-hydroxyacyl-CoA dehydrogenase/enoyl-CoA hydratase/3-hydroxybutyryl-CoA epimerase
MTNPMTLFQTNNLLVEVQGATALLWLDVADRPVNVFHPAFLTDLDQALDRVAEQTALQILIVAGGKKTGFAAGADVHSFAEVSTPEQAVALSTAGQQVFDKLARLRLPTVARIHGLCLGGGLELALACDYRWAFDTPEAAVQVGFPEVELGLIPGWGGTQRLPRIVGLERAVQMILTGRRLGTRDAQRWGLVDAAWDMEPTDWRQPAEAIIRQGKPLRSWLPLSGWGQRLREGNPVGRWLIFRGAERILRRRVPDDMPAPFEALKAIQVGLSHGLEAGLAREREAIGRLATSRACHNLVNLFFQREQARKLPEDGALAKRCHVGVVGAGTMGAGIAQLAAVKGRRVFIQEVSDKALAAGMRKIEALFQKAVERRVLSDTAARTHLQTIQTTTTWEGFGDVDVVIEAVIEDLDAKRAVFRELERRVGPSTILATNTSSLPVAFLQEGASHPGRIGGLHFFNPVHKMPLVEVIRGPATDAATVAALTRLAVALGKTPVVVKDSPGFLVNRILMPYLNEAVLLAVEGMPASLIDRRMRRFGMPMGPLELLDQVGLDVAAHIARSVQPLLGERFPPNPVFSRMQEQGWLGQKSGVGFFRYKSHKKRENAELCGLLAKARTGEFRLPEDDEALDRMVLLMVNEAAACLGDSVVDRSECVDLAMVLGTGWAPHRGGPLRYAAERGWENVVRRLEELATKLGPRFEPCPELRQRVVPETEPRRV